MVAESRLGVTTVVNIPAEWAALGVTADRESGGLGIPVDLLMSSPFQTRTKRSLTEGLDTLTEEIARNGQIVLAEVRPAPGDPRKFEIVHGHRRALALMILQERRKRPAKLRAIVLDLDAKEAALRLVAENRERRDLTPLELARAAERLTVSAGMTQAETGRALGRSQPAIANLLRVLKTAPPAVLEWVDEGLTTFSALRPLVALRAEDGHDHPGDFQRIVEAALPDVYQSGDLAHPARRVREADILGALKRRLKGSLQNVYSQKDGKREARYGELARWRPLDAAAAELYSETRGLSKMPDRGDYETKAPGRVHYFGKLGVWACDATVWRALVSAEKAPGREAPAPASAGSGPPGAKSGADPKLYGGLTAVEYLRTHHLETRIWPRLRKRAPEGASDAEALGSTSELVDMSRATDPARYAAELPPAFAGALPMVYRSDDMETFAIAGKRYIAVDAFRRYMSNPVECRTCIKGRVFAIWGRGPKDHYGVKRNAKDVITLCGNLDCAAEKLLADTRRRHAVAAKARASETAVVSAARRQFPVLPREAATMLLAVLANNTEAVPVDPAHEQPWLIDRTRERPWLDRRTGAVHALATHLVDYGYPEAAAALKEAVKEAARWRRKEYLDRVARVDQTARLRNLAPVDALAKALASLSAEALSSVLFAVAMDVVRSGAAGEFWQPQATPYAALLLDGTDDGAATASTSHLELAKPGDPCPVSWPCDNADDRQEPCRGRLVPAGQNSDGAAMVRCPECEATWSTIRLPAEVLTAGDGKGVGDSAGRNESTGTKKGTI